MKKCIIMFIFLLFTILVAILTEKTSEIQVDERLLATDVSSDEIAEFNGLEK